MNYRVRRDDILDLIVEHECPSVEIDHEDGVSDAEVEVLEDHDAHFVVGEAECLQGTPMLELPSHATSDLGDG